MTRILNRVLQGPDRTYNLDPGTGDVAPLELETNQPVTMVHDVRRGAELAAAATAPGAALGAGFFTRAATDTHAAPGTRTLTLTVAGGILTSTGNAPEWNPATQDCWIVELGGFTSVNNTVVRVAVVLSSMQYGGAAPAAELLAYFNDDTNTPFGGLGGFFSYSTTVTPGPVVFGRPRLIYPTTQLSMISEASAAAVFSLVPVFWVGPKGITPPGIF